MSPKHAHNRVVVFHTREEDRGYLAPSLNVLSCYKYLVFPVPILFHPYSTAPHLYLAAIYISSSSPCLTLLSPYAPPPYHDLSQS